MKAAKYILNVFLDHLFEDSCGHRRPLFHIKFIKEIPIVKGKQYKFVGYLKERVFDASVILSEESGLNSIHIKINNKNNYPWIDPYINYQISDLNYLIFTKIKYQEKNIYSDIFKGSEIEVRNLQMYLIDNEYDEQCNS